MPLVNIHIDGLDLKAESYLTILEAAAQNNIYIPTLCNDERVEMYGSCGVCIVEAEKSPRLLRACSTFVSEGMVIKTNTERVKNTRKAALELLLSDHKGDCRAPCTFACPAETDCQGYIGLIANKQYKEAAKLIKEKLPLPSSIGRVCPHPCETACRRALVEEPVNIAHLKYFASDKFLGENEFIPEIAVETGKSVAIIGGGPGGLTAAYFLRQLGHNISVYDAMPEMGGMLRYGIPEYRLPKDILNKEIAIIEKMGVKLINNTKIGAAPAGCAEVTLDSLQSKFNAVVVAIGAWRSTGLDCPGENSNGVIGGIYFLKDVTLNKKPDIGKNVAIVGGGNTAMDACRTAIRLGADKVYNIYRRTRDEMPAEEIEIVEAGEEGVIFKYLTNPIEIIEENGRVSKVRLQKMKLGEPDKSGRRSPVPIEGEEETLAVDTVIIAIGQAPELSGFEGLELTKWKTIIADESSFRTNINGVFAVGDATNNGADIAITAIGEAKKAVPVIDGYLRGETVSYKTPYWVKSEPTAEDFADREKKPRVKMRHLSAEDRKKHFREINSGFSEDEAVNEAQRCLECGCADLFECKLIKIAHDYQVQPEKYSGEKSNCVLDEENVSNRSLSNHPFIHRNPDKCLLCGLCVRICEELMGVTALGLVGRGFDTFVKPAIETSLEESGCISCGQCVTVCPTGALTEKIAVYKQVPLCENSVETICSFCSVGCNIKLTSKGTMLLRSLPNNSCDKQQILCKKGRFGFTELEKLERVKEPLISGQAEKDLNKVSAYVSEKIQNIISKYGSEAAVISISDRLTNEEITLAKQYAEALGIGIYSFSRKKSGLKKDASTCSFDELSDVNVILLVATDVMNSHTVAGIKIRKAVQKGAKLIIINDGTIGLADEWCDVKLNTAKNPELLKQFVNGVKTSEVSITSEELKKTIELYKTSEKTIVIFEQDSLNKAEGAMLESISRGRIIQLKPNANSQGLADLGIGYSDEIIEKMKKQTVKGLINFAEDIDKLDEQINISGLEFLCVADVCMTESARNAEVVLPCASFAESSGSYTNTFGQVQKLNRALLPPGGFSNSEIIQSLKNAVGQNKRRN